jgi:hypothetical protein
VNSKQIVAAISAIVLVIILVYPAVAVGSVSVTLSSTKILRADHVFLTITNVWAHPASQAAGVGWVLISNQSVSLDLVSLENSSKLLGSGRISSGAYDSIRIEVSNATWVFNKTTTSLGIASPEIEGTLDFTVATATPAMILLTIIPQEQLIANSEYFSATIGVTLTS